MTAPTLENGPYIFNVNNYFNDYYKEQRILLELKNALVALGGAGVIWQVVASSDGSSVVNIGGGSPDLWASNSDIINANDGSPHSWAILENQTTGGQLCIDCNNSNDNYCTVVYSYGGNFATDGTTSDRPTTTEAGTIASNTYSFWNTSSEYREFVVNVMASADHVTTRWYIHGRSSISGRYGGWFGSIEAVVNAPSGWTSNPKQLTMYYPGNFESETVADYQSPRLFISDGNSLRCYVETAEPYAGWLSAYMTCECYQDIDETDRAMPLTWNNADQDVIGGYPVCPIGVFRAGGDQGGSLGRLRDIYLAQRTHTTLSTYPADASRTWIKFGAYLVPWNGEVPRDAV